MTGLRILQVVARWSRPFVVVATIAAAVVFVVNAKLRAYGVLLYGSWAGLLLGFWFLVWPAWCRRIDRQVQRKYGLRDDKADATRDRGQS